MAGLQEFNSFVGKFFHLWKSGCEANLKVNTKAGQAFINLEVGLGKVPQHHFQPHPQPSRKPNPSRLRRTQKRKEARAALAEQAATVAENAKSGSNYEDAENVSVAESVNEDREELIDPVLSEQEASYEMKENIDDTCDSCVKMFAFHGELRENMCDVCLVNIALEEKIYLPNRYKCQVCGLTFNTKTQFKRHKQCDFEDISLSFVCEACNLKWTDEQQFEHHYKKKHVMHVCVRCSKKFEGKDNLDEHYRLKHRAF